MLPNSTAYIALFLHQRFASFFQLTAPGLFWRVSDSVGGYSTIFGSDRHFFFYSLVSGAVLTSWFAFYLCPLYLFFARLGGKGRETNTRSRISPWPYIHIPFGGPGAIRVSIWDFIEASFILYARCNRDEGRAFYQVSSFVLRFWHQFWKFLSGF